MKKFISKNTRDLLKWIGAVFLTWRLFLVLVVWLGTQFFPICKDHLGGGITQYLEKPLLWVWANFDGVDYLSIAQPGDCQCQQALSPFYPYLIRFVAEFLKNYLFSGLLISHLSLLAALFLFYQLVRLDFSKGIAKRSLVYLLLFPTSFYFGSVYPESLFLALVLGAFLAARKRRWAIAAVLGALASATQLMGIFLFPALLFEWWQQRQVTRTKDKVKSLLPLFLILAGLFAFLWYLKKTMGDLFYFVHIQPYFGAQKTGGRIILLYQVFWRYLKMLVTVEKMTPTYLAVVLEAFSGGLFLLLTLFAYLRRWLSYFIFMVLAYLTPTLAGTLTSMPRYVLVLFPGFLLLAIWAEKYPWLRRLYPLIAIPLLIISLLLFSRGFFAV